MQCRKAPNFPCGRLKKIVFSPGEGYPRLRLADNTFDYIVCQAVFTFVSHQEALSEVRRVLKDYGAFAGLKFCWRRLPPRSFA
jgi:ubiquinone/menaquinone biosynthesis C-methylase UbiE